MTKLIPHLTLATCALLFAGCASSGYKQAARTSSSLQDAAQGIDQSLAPLDIALATLTDLSDNPRADITAQFKKYRAAVTRLESTSDTMRVNATAMKERGADYFKTWDEELAKIRNEDIHTRSLDRKNAVAARFERVRVSYVQATADFAPLMADLKDIRTALATDLTPGGLASIKGLAAKANLQAPALRMALSQLSADFKELGVALSPATPAK
jgi:hypothetical protein